MILALRQMGRQAAADPHGFDCSREAVIIIGLEKDAAQRGLALCHLRTLAGHLGDKAQYCRSLLHADDRIVIAAHAGVGLVSGAAGQDLVV